MSDRSSNLPTQATSDDNASNRKTTIVGLKSRKREKQTSGSAFSGPVKWFPDGASFGVDENGQFICPTGDSVPATLRTDYAKDDVYEHKEYSQNGKPFDLEQASIFVPDQTADGTSNASKDPKGKWYYLCEHKGALCGEKEEERELWVAFGGDVGDDELPTKRGAFSGRADHFFIHAKE